MSTFQIYGKRLVENYLIKLYESKTKKNLNESFHKGATWLLSVRLDIIWKNVE